MQGTEHPLSQMRPLVLPEGIDAWPLAPGWYVLTTIVLVSVTILTVLMIQKRRKELFKRQALKELETIKSSIEKTTESITQQNDALSNLLKRIALTHYPRSLISPLHGEQWLAFLDEISNSQFFTQGDGKLLGESRFKKPQDNQLENDYQALMNCIDRTEKLIKQFRVKKQTGNHHVAV